MLQDVHMRKHMVREASAGVGSGSVDGSGRLLLGASRTSAGSGKQHAHI